VQIHYSEGELDTKFLLPWEKELCFAVTHYAEEARKELDCGTIVSGKMAQGKVLALLLLGHI